MQFCALSVALAVDDCASHSQLSITEWAVGVRSISNEGVYHRLKNSKSTTGLSAAVKVLFLIKSALSTTLCQDCVNHRMGGGCAQHL